MKNTAPSYLINNGTTGAVGSGSPLGLNTDMNLEVFYYFLFLSFLSVIYLYKFGNPKNHFVRI